MSLPLIAIEQFQSWA